MQAKQPHCFSYAVMAITVLSFSVAFERLEEVLPPSPYFASLGRTAITTGIIFLGASLAFMMVSCAVFW